jgi:ArsR family transcriptional regulator
MNIYSYIEVRSGCMDKETTNFETCSCTIIHEEVVNKVREKMIEEDHAIRLAELFKVFGDTTRVKILNALFSSEMCVCDISVLLGMNQSAISHQLKTLKQARLIKSRRDGKVVYYSLDDEHIKEIFDKGLTHVKE